MDEATRVLGERRVAKAADVTLPPSSNVGPDDATRVLGEHRVAKAADVTLPPSSNVGPQHLLEGPPLHTNPTVIMTWNSNGVGRC